MGPRAFVVAVGIALLTAACVPSPAPVPTIGPPVTTVTPVTVSGCVGRTDDVAGTVNGETMSTGQLFDLLATLGGPPPPDMVLQISDASVSLLAPASAPAGSRPTSAVTLHLGSVAVRPGVADVRYGFGVGTVVVGGVRAQVSTDTSPDTFALVDSLAQAINLSALAPFRTDASGARIVHMPATGALHYRLVSVDYQLVVNASDGPALSLGTLSFTCPLNVAIGVTTIQ